MDHFKILLIEDEEAMRDVYKRSFEASGYIVDAVENGVKGLDQVSQIRYDLVLLDIMLPDINGLEILKRIKEIPDYKDTPIVLLTNIGQDQIINKAFSLGATAYLVKASYSAPQIVDEVSNLLKNVNNNR